MCGAEPFDGVLMKIFISWSGARSRAVADLLTDWVGCVLQASQPWISTRHIDRGALWFSEISEKLVGISVGIVCLTKENKNKPWILFECGALAKGLSTSRVCTLLIDLEAGDITDPLAQFNHTTPDKSSMRSLVATLNTCMEERALAESTLDRVFETFWPEFEASFAEVLTDYPPAEELPALSDTEILKEILSVTRTLSTRLSVVESRTSNIKASGATKFIENEKNLRLLDKAVEMGVDGATERDLIEFMVKNNMPISLADSIITKVIRNQQNNDRDPLL